MEKVAVTDSLFQESIIVFDRIAKEMDLEYMLVGAYARNQFFPDSKEKLITTYDVDFGIQVTTWDEFTIFRNELLESGHFALGEGDMVHHRIFYKGTLCVDIIPFGDLATSEGVLTCWPDDFKKEMNVLGFREAVQTAQLIESSGLKIKRVDVEFFTVLKIFAWHDRQSIKKDAEDIAYIFRNIDELESWNKIFYQKSNEDINGSGDYEIQIIRALAREIKKKLPQNILDKVLEILAIKSHLGIPKISVDMVKANERKSDVLEEYATKVYAFIEELGK